MRYSELYCILKRYPLNALALFRFFQKGKSKLIYTKIHPSVLFSFLDEDIIDTVSGYIDVAQRSDLDLIDRLSLTDKFWVDEGDWPIEYHPHKYLLKLGWLIKNIRDIGLENPLQLLQSADNKYVAHPGTARALVLSYIIPSQDIPVFYIWNPALDPNPFFVNQDYTEIKSAWQFYKIFKRSYRFSIKAGLLNETVNCDDCTKYAYLDIANTHLKKTHKKYELDFITVVDDGHWMLHIKHKVFLKDIISFQSDTECTLSGVEFIKVKDKWIIK